MLEKDLVDSFIFNVVAVLKVTQAFLPLIKKGSAKKVAAISSGLGDVDLVNKYDVATAVPYSISKTALNAAVAKLNATYREEEKILFLSISPGIVATEKNIDRE